MFAVIFAKYSFKNTNISDKALSLTNLAVKMPIYRRNERNRRFHNEINGSFPLVYSPSQSGFDKLQQFLVE